MKERKRDLVFKQNGVSKERRMARHEGRPNFAAPHSRDGNWHINRGVDAVGYSARFLLQIAMASQTPSVLEMLLSLEGGTTKTATLHGA